MSNSQAEKTSRISRSMLMRVTAVGLFMTLGTAAVIHTMNRTRPAGTAVANEEAPNDDAKNSNADNQPDDAGSDSNPSPGLATNNQFAPKRTFSRPKIESDPLKRVAGGSIANEPAKTVADNAFSQPKTQKITTAKLAATPEPPVRFAQRPGGVPIVGNDNGFQAKTPASVTIPPRPGNDNNFAASLESPRTRTEQTAPQPLRASQTNVTNAAKKLLAETQNAASETTNELRQKLNDFASIPASPNPTSPAKAATSGLPPLSTREPSTPSNATAPTPPFSRLNQSTPTTTTPSRAIATSSPNTAGNPSSQYSAGTRQSAPTASSGFTPMPGSNPLATQQTGSSNRAAAPANNRGQATPSNSFPPLGNQNASPLSATRSSPGAPATTRSRLPSPNTARPTQTTPRPVTPPVAAKSAPPAGSSNRPRSRLTAGDLSGAVSVAALTNNQPGSRELEGAQTPALTVEKISPREIQVNQPADFQLVIKNVGRVAAENVQVFDQIPAGTEFISASPEPKTTGQSVQWQIGKIRPGQEKRIKIQLRPTRPGEIGSVAQVTFSTQATMRTLVTQPILEIEHKSKPTHLIGDDVMLDVIVRNKGDGAAKNVLIQEDVPQQLEFQDGYRELEYEVGTLLPGQSRRVRLALKAAEIGKIRNVMFASADGGLQTKHELNMEIVAPKLVTKSDGPRRRFLQRNVTHQFSVANQGTASATNVELVARLPSGLKFVKTNNRGRYDSSGHLVRWSLAELARDVDAKVELETVPVEVGNQPIKFEAFADLDARSSVEQQLSVEHLVDVFFDIDDVVDPIEIGSDTSYRVRIVNQGTKAATNVELQVTFPPGIQPTSVEGSLRHQISGQRIVFEPIGTMAPRDEIGIIVHGKGQSAGDHRVVVSMKTDGRQTPVSKEETTRVYSDY